MIAQDRVCAWSWQRSDDDTWTDEPEIVTDIETAVPLPSLGLALALAEIYRRVPLPS